MQGCLRGLAAAIGGLAILLPAFALADDLADELKRRQQEQTELRQQIIDLQQQIEQKEAQRQEASDSLKSAEIAISASVSKLNELEQQQKNAQHALDDLNLQIARQKSVLGQQQRDLAEQLRKQYQSGISPLSAWLSGSDPQALGRQLTYMDYVAKARAAELGRVQSLIDRLAALQARADDKQRELTGLISQEAEQKALLDDQRKARATLFAQLEGQLTAQRSEAGRLDQDEKHLSALIAGLDEQIVAAKRLAEAKQREEQLRLAAIKQREEQAREAAKRRDEEAKRREREARRKEAESRAIAPTVIETTASEPTANEPTTSEPTANEPTAQQRVIESKDSVSANPSADEGLKSGLRWPVRGRLMARFGTDRPEGGVWRGLLIKAPEGTPVQAIANGTVVYATWLRGFGNIIIIDHGQQSLSIYAYLQSLYKQVGEVVAAGNNIGTVGNTGGQVDSALYFELRRRNVAIDPAPLLSK